MNHPAVIPGAASVIGERVVSKAGAKAVLWPLACDPHGGGRLSWTGPAHLPTLRPSDDTALYGQLPLFFFLM